MNDILKWRISNFILKNPDGVILKKILEEFPHSRSLVLKKLSELEKEGDIWFCNNCEDYHSMSYVYAARERSQP